MANLSAYKEIGHWETKAIADRQKKNLQRKGYICKITRRESRSLSPKPYEYTLYAKRKSYVWDDGKRRKRAKSRNPHKDFYYGFGDIGLTE